MPSVCSEGYGHGGPGICLGDGQTEAEGVRGDAMLRRMPPYLTWPDCRKQTNLDIATRVESIQLIQQFQHGPLDLTLSTWITLVSETIQCRKCEFCAFWCEFSASGCTKFAFFVWILKMRILCTRMRFSEFDWSYRSTYRRVVLITTQHNSTTQIWFKSSLIAY